jgi:hypothetical protein
MADSTSSDKEGKQSAAELHATQVTAILARCDPTMRARMALVSKEWRKAAEEPSFWMVLAVHVSPMVCT